jgi:hypothetical protein
LLARRGCHCRFNGSEDESWKNGFPTKVGSFQPTEWIGQERLLLFYWQIAAHLHQILKEFSAVPYQAPKNSVQFARREVQYRGRNCIGEKDRQQDLVEVVGRWLMPDFHTKPTTYFLVARKTMT